MRKSGENGEKIYEKHVFLGYILLFVMKIIISLVRKSASSLTKSGDYFEKIYQNTREDVEWRRQGYVKEKRIGKFQNEEYSKVQDEMKGDAEVLRRKKQEKRLTVVIIIALLIFLYLFETDYAKHTVIWGWCILPCLAMAILIGAGVRFLYEKFSLRYKARMELQMKQMDKMFRPLVKRENFKNKYEAIIFLQYFHRKPWQLRLLQFSMWIYITVAFEILGEMFDIVIPEGGLWIILNFAVVKFTDWISERLLDHTFRDLSKEELSDYSEWLLQRSHTKNSTETSPC